MKAELSDGINFIFELNLAKLELHSFNAEYEITDDIYTFNIKKLDNEDEFIKRAAYFKNLDNKETYYSKITNCNITKRRSLFGTHSFYPYKGKFHPQMIRCLLNCAKVKENETVLDPFIGSGTTSVEAQLLGINSIGIDISPLCVLMSEVKTKSIFYLDEIISHNNELQNLNTEDEISYFIENINNIYVKNFFKLFFIHYNVSLKNRFGINQFKKIINEKTILLQNLNNVVNQLNLKLGNSVIIQGDVKNIQLKDESIDAIITSPPYACALDYAKKDKDALSMLGINYKEMKQKIIGTRGRGNEVISLYKEDMKKAYEEMYRVLKNEKYCIVVIGNNVRNGNEINSIKTTIDLCQNVGFTLEKNIKKYIYGLYNVIFEENILFFLKK